MARKPKGEAEDTSDRPPKKDIEYVKYIGTSDVRSVKLDGGVVLWSAENDFKQSASDFSAADLDLLATQKDFELK